MASSCPFCEIETKRIWLQNGLGVVAWDAFPISKGHSLVIPKQHVRSIYDLSDEEHSVMWGLVKNVKSRLMEELEPDGFNIGLNDGEMAGQTVMHAHIHVIPRWKGDVADPRGGVRWIIPDKARYWGD